MSNVGRVATATFYKNMSERMQTQQSAMYGAQREMSTGKRINDPSDDPMGAAKLSIIKDQLEQNKAFKNAIDSAQGSLEGSTSAVSTALGQLQNAFQLAVQARNGSYSPADLKNIGATLKGVASSLVQTANSQDGSGNYVFSGAQSQTQPFQFDGVGYAYSGDQTVAYARTNTATLTQTSWTGASLFAGGFSGDGTVDAKASAGNSGNAVVAKVAQSSPGSFGGGQYSVAFSNPTGSKMEATVTDLATSAVVAGPLAYESGQPIAAAGVNLTIDGAPAAGDSFTIGPATKVNVLDSVSRLAETLLNADKMTKSQMQNALAAGQSSIAAGLSNLTTEAALMGSEIASVGVQKSTNEDRKVSLESSRSGLEDVDLAKAISEFTAQKTALTASLQSFASISGLSLFNYMR